MALAQTLVHSEVASHLATGCLRQADVHDVVVGHTSSLQLLVVQSNGKYRSVSRQAAHAVIRDLAVLPWKCTQANPEMLVSLLQCHCLHCCLLHYIAVI